MAFVHVTASMAAPLRGRKRWAYLSRQEFIRVATQDADGSLYLSSLWYVVESETIYLPIDAAGKHAANIEAGRAFTALVDSGNEYATVVGVRIFGRPERVTEQARFDALEQMVFDKYFYEGHPYAAPYFSFGHALGRTYYALKPDKMIGWDSREVAAPQAVESHLLPDFVTDRRL